MIEADAHTRSRSDTDLLESYAAGDQSAARALTARLVPGIHALAWRMLNDHAEAEDVTQEAMLRLWRIAPNWSDRGAQVSTWLYRVATNLCIDRLRKRGRNVATEEVPELPDGVPEVVAKMEADERARALKDALTDLPERQRTAIILRHFEDRTNPEIAEILDASVEAVESLLSRARRTLASRLAPLRPVSGLVEGAD